MKLRAYESADCQAILQLFRETVHKVNAKDYSPQQLAAWAPEELDAQGWDQSLLAHTTLVAQEGGQIVGFADLAGPDYLDRLYVHCAFQGRGIATALCNRLEELAGPGEITVHASITAKEFFQKRGYRLIKEQQVERRGVLLTNFEMKKTL